MRVAVTDYALSCATGIQTDEALNAIFLGQSGLTQERGRFIGRVPCTLPSLPHDLVQYETRQAQLAHFVLEQIKDSIENAKKKWGPTRIAILVGTSTGGIEWTEKNYDPKHHLQSPKLKRGAYQKHGFGALTEMIQLAFGIQGLAFSISTACSSSTHIFGSALRLIQQGQIDAALVIGVDTLCALTLRGFEGLGILSDSTCKPFDASRDGINIGEAGAAILLERDVDAEILLRGFGSSSDGYHMTSPPPDGAGAVQSMKTALHNAKLSKDDIFAINAHGTGTLENDNAESNAIHTIWGSSIPVVSTKAFTGHTLGAAGAVDAIVCIESLKRQRIPSTLGLKKRDVAIEIKVSAESQSFSGNAILSNSFAFGGNNASIILEKI